MFATLLIAVGGIWKINSSGGPEPEETALLNLAREHGLDATGDFCEVTDRRNDLVVASVFCYMPGVPDSPGNRSVTLLQYGSLTDLQNAFSISPGYDEATSWGDGHVVQEDKATYSKVVWSDESTKTINTLMSINRDLTATDLYVQWLDYPDLSQ